MVGWLAIFAGVPGANTIVDEDQLARVDRVVRTPAGRSEIAHWRGPQNRLAVVQLLEMKPVITDSRVGFPLVADVTTVQQEITTPIEMDTGTQLALATSTQT